MEFWRLGRIAEVEGISVAIALGPAVPLQAQDASFPLELRSRRAEKAVYYKI